MDIERRLSKAKTGLLLEHPFFGKLTAEMPFQFSTAIPTACTNGKRVLFNPDFVAPLNDGNITFLVAHEVCHPMLEHNFRRQGRCPNKFNYAGDCIINHMLIEEGIGQFIEGGVNDPDLYNRGGGTTDGVYNLLPEMPDAPVFTGTGQAPYDICEDGMGTPAEIQEQAGKWKIKVAQAAQAAKMMGRLSAGLERFVEEILHTRVSWEEVMHRFVVKCISDQRTFARASRRFASQGMYLPSRSGEQLGEIAFSIDCSGSIGDEELSEFGAEVKKIYHDYSPKGIHIIYFDSEVCHYDYFKNEEPVLKPHGGGGTDFAPVFDYMREHDIEPVCNIFLTDMCCSSFGNPPDCPVLWVSNMKYEEPPFGEAILMEGVK